MLDKDLVAGNISQHIFELQRSCDDNQSLLSFNIELILEDISGGIGQIDRGDIVILGSDASYLIKQRFNSVADGLIGTQDDSIM